MTPTPEQIAAVKAFAARHGRCWKVELRNAWLYGSDVQEPDGHLLRQVRNSCGPVWLQGFKL